VEKLAGDPGAEIQLGDVLLVGDDDSVTVGTPVVDGASVRGTITAQARHPKIRVFKMKRRKGYRRMQGHRQDYTEVQVDSIDQ
jgi:large subunit ribosomal protein L21